MEKWAYRKALELQLRNLMDRAATLKCRWEHAEGVQKFRILWELQRLERRERMLEDRLHERERQENGLWPDIKADVRAVLDDLPGGIEGWIERLDASYEARSLEMRDEPAAAPGSSRSRSFDPKT